MISEIIPAFYEANPKRYDFGCVMLHFSFFELTNIHAAITPSHIYSFSGDNGKFGLKQDAHITLLYGLHGNVTENDIESKLGNFSYSNCKLNNVSLFKQKYDVLKFDVDGKNLSESNTALRTLPHTTDFPIYHPHLTIAYLKQGLGDRYVKRLARTEYSLKPKHIEYTKQSGRKYKLDIKIK